MKLAVTYENGEVYQHFGHTKYFKLYDIENNQIVSSEIVDTNGSGHGALTKFLASYGTEVLICGGIGAGAQNALADEGIKFYGGVKGDSDKAVQNFIDGNLNYISDIQCEHHKSDSGHECGNSSCESHSCKDHSCH